MLRPQVSRTNSFFWHRTVRLADFYCGGIAMIRLILGTATLLAVAVSFSPGGGKADDKKDPLQPLLAASNPAKLNAAQKDAVKALLADMPLTSAQRELLHVLAKGTQKGLTSAMRTALSESLARDSARADIGKSAKKKPEPVTKPPIETEPKVTFDPTPP